MNSRMMLMTAFFSALWIFGLMGSLDSPEAVMRYLTLSMAIVAFGVWRWQPKAAVRRRFRDRRHPPQ